MEKSILSYPPLKKEIAKRVKEPFFNWYEVVTRVCSNTAGEFEAFLQDKCRDVYGQILIAKSTQIKSKEKINGSYQTAYEIVNSTKKTLHFFSTIKLTKKEYMTLIVRYTGLWAIRAYLEEKFDKGRISSNYRKKYVLFEKLVDLFASEMNQYNQNYAIKSQLNNFLSNLTIPKGIYSAQFFDLITALKNLTTDELRLHCQQYADIKTTIPALKEELYDEDKYQINQMQVFPRFK